MLFFYMKKKNNNNSNFTTYFIIITYLKTLSMVVFCNNRQACLNKLQKQWLLLVLHCFMGRFQSGLQSFKMAALEEELPVSVLFMFGEEKIKANINFGASRSDLIEAFQISTTNDLILQHYDNEWEEWINLPDEFTASTKIKLKVISKPSVPVQLNFNLETKSHSSKQATLKASSGSWMLVVDKTNQIKEVQPFESYLIPNPLSARLQYYNDVVPVLYTECFTDFSSKERFQYYLIAERRWRFGIESDINSLASKVDEIKSNSANSHSGNSYDIQRLQSIPHDANSEDVFRCERAIGALEKTMNSSQDITNRLSEKRKIFIFPPLI